MNQTLSFLQELPDGDELEELCKHEAWHPFCFSLDPPPILRPGLLEQCTQEDGLDPENQNKM